MTMYFILARDTVAEVLRPRIESYQIAQRQNLGFFCRVDHKHQPSKKSRSQVVDRAKSGYAAWPECASATLILCSNSLKNVTFINVYPCISFVSAMGTGRTAAGPVVHRQPRCHSYWARASLRGALEVIAPFISQRTSADIGQIVHWIRQAEQIRASWTSVRKFDS
jgi:hypothetical protein